MEQDHYKNLLMSAPVGYAYHRIILDEKNHPCDYVFLDANPAFEQLTGLETSLILNKRVTEILPGITDDGFDWIGKFGEIALNRGNLMFEQYSKPLKKWFRVQVHSSEKLHFSTVFVDITATKQEEEVQNLLLDNIRTQIWYLSDLEHYGRVNQAHADFLGIPKEKLQHKSLYDFLKKHEADQCVIANKQVFEGKKPVTTEEWVVNGKGERRLLRVNKNPKLDDRGNVEYVVCSADDITARRNAKQALRLSEEKFRHIFHNSPLGIFHSDINGVITDCNDSFVTIIGSSQEAIVGLNILDLPDIRVRNAMIGALEGRKMTFEGEYASTTADKITPLRAFFAPITDDSEKVNGAIGIVEDITERKKAEMELRISEQKLRSLIEGIDEVIFVLNNDLVITEFSQPISRKLLRAKEEFLGKSLDEIEFPEPAKSRILTALMETRDTGEFTNLEYYLDMPDGRFWYDMNITSAKDFDGHRILIGVIRDATRRKEAEQALRESETKYRQLFDDSPISLWEQDFSDVKKQLDEICREPIDDLRAWFMDRPGLVRELAAKVKVLDVNKATVRQYHARSKEELTAGIHQVFVDESYPAFMEALVLIAQGGREFSLVKKHKTLDGKELDVELHWAVISGYESTYSRVITSVFDLTDRKRTEEIIQKNLQEKNVLLSEIHHRVKNNMAVISSLLTLQSEFEEHNSKSPKEILQDTRNRVHSMSLVHELVYETNNFAEISFNRLLQRLATNIDQAYGSDDKDISVTISAEELMLELNQSLPCTLLANELISNAYLHAFKEKKEGTIEVSFFKEDGHYHLIVRDDGKGVDDPGKLEKPDSFGYTIIHGLVNQMRGSIEVHPQYPGLAVAVVFEPHKPFDTGSSSDN